MLLLLLLQCTLRKLAGRARLQGVSWLAPECFRGEGLSKYSDVYAFGILMWELYTGEVRRQATTDGKLWGAACAAHCDWIAPVASVEAHCDMCSLQLV